MAVNSALLSLFALAAVIAASLLPHVNAGVLAMALAWGAGAHAGLEAARVAQGFPSSLFLILFAVTFLFGLAHANGTLEKAASWAVRLSGGHPSVLPLVFFALAVAISSAGPGNIAATALLAPLAMAAAARAGIGALLMAVMVCTGANAGTFSPFAMTGLLANGLIARQGLSMDPWTQVYLPALLTQSAVALGAYLALGGLHAGNGAPPELPPRPVFTGRQTLTLISLAAYMGAVGIARLDPAFSALTLAALLTLVGAADAREGLKTVPWSVIVMICGIGQLVSVMEATGGMELFTTWLSRWARPSTASGFLAFLGGLLSSYSSSSGVVLPALLPMIPSLVEKMGGGDPVSLVAAVNVGSHLVDASPLSTLGALCLASAGPHEDKERLFRRLLAFGLSMSLVGGLVCWLFFGLLR